MQMLILNRLRLKTDFSQKLSLRNNDVFKGKVFEQNETLQPIEKSSRKF
jgi:hypothetical protein